MFKTAVKIVAIVATVLWIAWIVSSGVMDYQFDKNCRQYLVRAANASCVELAIEDLEKALDYAESKNLTKGIVSIFLEQPKNDIGYWYRNIYEALNELKSLSPEASTLGKTNALMQLKETLLTDDATATTPSDIGLYPHNKAYFWWGMVTSFVMILCWLILWKMYRDDHPCWR